LNTSIQELVHFIEAKHSIYVYRACTVKPHPKQKYTFAHIEFQNKEDATKIIEISREMQGTGLDYGGRAIHVVPDRTLPDWGHCDPALLYEKIVATNSKSNLLQEKSDASTEPATAESTTAESATAEPATADDSDTENQETIDLFLEISATLQTQNELSEGNNELEYGPSALNTTHFTEMPVIHDPELDLGNAIAFDQNTVG
jgi:RNA recognition motif-containing protein